MIVFCFYKVSKFELTVELTIEQTENDKVKNSFSLFFMEKTCCKHCQLQEQRTHQSSKACCRCHLYSDWVCTAVMSNDVVKDLRG